MISGGAYSQSPAALRDICPARAGPSQNSGKKVNAGGSLLQQAGSFCASLPKIEKSIGSRVCHLLQASSHALPENFWRRLGQQPCFKPSRTDQPGERQKGRILEGRVAHMDMRVHKAGADNALTVCLYLLCAKLADDSVPDTDVAALLQKIVAVDYGSLQQDLARFRHILKMGGQAI